MSDGELMRFRDTHNFQSDDRAMAIRVLQERDEAKQRGDFSAIHEQGERGYRLNRRIFWWAVAAFVAGAIGAVASIIQAFYSWRGSH
jgi:hypothetical protein